MNNKIYHCVQVNNTMKKPGPVFLEMARAAYSAGADYFYRINDDTELMVNWPAKFVAGMQVRVHYSCVAIALHPLHVLSSFKIGLYSHQFARMKRVLR